MAHRPRWTLSQVTELFEKPLLDCCLKRSRCIVSISIHVRCRSAPLLSIKTGACPEHCKILPAKLARQNRLEAERLMEVEQVLESARKAKAAGSTRFGMGAAWKNSTNAICRTCNKW
ncbi:hypothetical protein ACLK1S_04740 [Escherichia coli]